MPEDVKNHQQYISIEYPELALGLKALLIDYRKIFLQYLSLDQTRLVLALTLGVEHIYDLQVKKHHKEIARQGERTGMVFYRGQKLTKFSILDVRMISRALELVGNATFSDKILDQLSRGVIYPNSSKIPIIYQAVLQAKSVIFVSYSPADQKRYTRILRKLAACL